MIQQRHVNPAIEVIVKQLQHHPCTDSQLRDLVRAHCDLEWRLGLPEPDFRQLYLNAMVDLRIQQRIDRQQRPAEAPVWQLHVKPR